MNKTILKSKTFYFGIITAFAPLFPVVASFMAENTASISMVWGSVAILLRFITKDKVVLIE